MNRISLFSFLLILIFTVSCGEQEADSKQLKKKDKDLTEAEFISLVEEQEMVIDSISPKFVRAEAEEMMKRYLRFTNHFPDHSKSPEFVFKAANIAIGLNNVDKSIDLLHKVVDVYPDYKKAKEALYLLGFVYDYHANKKDKAEEIYNLVIEHYPHTDFANDAHERLKTLHMSDEDMIRMFEEKNKEQEPS